VSNIVESKAKAFESALIEGDLSRLSSAERISYYNSVCQSVGLNPLTKPMEFIRLNGKLVLYAKKDATDQLRNLQGISIEKIESKLEGGLYQVIITGKNQAGRMDSDIGVVDVANLKGVDLANAMMKATTKAKRRFTLSLAGLGVLDETEIEDIPKEAKTLDFDNDPFHKRTIGSAQGDEVIDGPMDSIVDSLPQDLGEYEIKVGKKYKGFKLKDIDMFKLDDYLNWMKEESDKKQSPLTGDWLEAYQKGQEFLSARDRGQTR